MTIRVLITGGTIDKAYDALTGKLVFGQSHMPEMLSRSRLALEVSPEVLFLKDSLDIVDTDRELILRQCMQSDEHHILISHGTDTMVETAHLLGKHINHKIIVLFGAMIPYSVDHSDALFNLGFALRALQVQKPGVYIAMNGHVFAFDAVRKNKALGIFESVSVQS